MARDVEKHTDDITKLQDDVSQLHSEFRDLLEVVRQMHAEYVNDRSNAAREREMLLLRVENLLLKSGHALPDSPQKTFVQPE